MPGDDNFTRRYLQFLEEFKAALIATAPPPLTLYRWDTPVPHYREQPPPGKELELWRPQIH